jgi:hypothetical protein
MKLFNNNPMKSPNMSLGDTFSYIFSLGKDYILFALEIKYG